MAGELERMLLRLQDCCNKKLLRDIPCIIRSISEFFDEELTKTELDHAFEIVFSENNGVIKFLRTNCNNVQFKDGVREAFELFHNLLENFPKRITSYVCSIKGVCLLCVSSDLTATEKVKALELLQNILKLKAWEQDLKIPEMIRKLEMNYSKAAQTVQQNMLNTFGIIAHLYPEQTDFKRLLKRYLDVIRREGMTSYKSFNLIIGCLSGLGELLHNLDLSSEDNVTNCKEVYNFLKMVISRDAPKRVAQRAALSVIELHGEQFAELIYNEYKLWHTMLLKWTDMPDIDRKAGTAALQSFYRVIANVLCEKTEDTAKPVFKYFIDNFLEKMALKSTPTSVLQTAIKAFGDFSKSGRIFWTQNDIEYAFCYILNLAEGICLEYSTQEDTNLRMKHVWHLPHYLESLGKLLTLKEIVEHRQVSSLEHIMVLLIRIFPFAHDSSAASIVRAFQSFFCNLFESKVLLLGDVINVVVYQALILTCSHCLLIDMELQKEQQQDGSKIITYKNYIKLWKSLLLAQNYSVKGITISTKIEVVHRIHSTFISVLLQCMKKLNLHITKKSLQESEAFYIEGDLKAEKPKDFNIFINLTDFSQEIFLDIDPNLFKNHCEEFITHVILESVRAPNISGFYKLLASVLKVCEKLQFFGDDLIVDKTKLTCYWNIVNFLRDTVQRMQQYTGDLLSACMQLILSSPSIIIHPIIKEMAEILPMILKAAQSYLDLGHKAMDSLEKWTKEIPPQDMDPLIIKILSHLEPFLQSRSAGFDKDVELQLLETEDKWRKSQRRLRKFKRGSAELPQTELVRLQWRILHFLGSLRSDTSPALLEVDPLTFNNDWGYTKHLPFRLPFTDIRPIIWLDTLLPRIIDLTLNSGDRKTRVAACELLQATVMLMLGKKWQENDGGEEKDKLFNKIISTVIKLGCDSDQVVLQIFQPLALQMIHWYSSRFQYKTKYSLIVVEIVMDGITHPTDSAVRKFCCKCLHEFVTWSMKQLKQSELEESPCSIEAVIKQICFLCKHPSFSKRLGAALAFNSIYRKLREENSIIDRFGFDLLYYMLKNLSHADVVDSIIGGTSEVCSALDHIRRILEERAELFNKASDIRHKPPEFEGVQLSHAATWLLKQCSAVQPDCRHTSMKLVLCLIPHIPGVTSVREFVSNIVLEKGLEFLRGICDADNKLDLPNNPHNLEMLMEWIAVLTASLDCYVWVYENEIREFSMLFSQGSERIFEAAKYFVKNIALEKGNPNALPSEIENYRRYKFIAAESLIRFIHVICLANEQSQNDFLKDFLSVHELWEFVSHCLVKPTDMGFGGDIVEIHSNLMSRMEDLMKILKLSLQENLVNFVFEILNKLLGNYETVLFDTLEFVLKEDAVEATHKDLVQALTILVKSMLYQDVIKVQSPGISLSRKIIEKLFSAIVINERSTSVAINLRPCGKAYAVSLLELAYFENKEVDVLLNLLVYGPKVFVAEKSLKVRQGEHFITQLREPVLSILLGSGFDGCHVVELLIDKSLKADTSGWLLRILNMMLQYAAQKHSRLSKSASDELGHKVLSYWKCIEKWADARLGREWEIVDLLTRVIELFHKPVGCLTRYEAVCSWIIRKLDSEKKLQQKNRLLDLLPYIVNAGVDEHSQIWELLLDLKRDHIPISTSELTEGSVELATFVTCFHKLLSALEFSGHRIFLKFIVLISAADDTHVCWPSIQKMLPDYMKSLTIEEQEKSLETVYSVFSAPDYEVMTRWGSISKFLVPLIHSSDITAVVSFGAKHIRQILERMSERVDNSNSFSAKHTLASKFGSCKLVEVLNFKCINGMLEDKDSPIVKAAFPNAAASGKELIKDFFKRLRSIRSEPDPLFHTDGGKIMELFRKMQCAAYNALITVITNTKFEERFISHFLFAERNNEKIWEKIVNCQEDVKLPIDWETVPQRRKMLVQMRQKHSPAYDATETGHFTSYIPSYSQLLLQSSLAEDVTQFDFTRSVVRPHGPSQRCNEQEEATEVYLEMDDINQHDCMPVLCALLQNMLRQEVIKLPQQEEEIVLPEWMNYLKNCILSERHNNIKIFIVKLILNNEKIFSPYAKHWLYPLLCLIKSKSLGNEINYFVTDLLSLLLSWNKTAIPDSNNDEKSVASDVFNFIVESAYHRRRDVMKHNLELIKTVVELWKSCLTVPYRQISNILTKEYDTDKDSEFGIQLVGAICCNKINPWNAETLETVLNTLVTKLTVKSREVYLPCSELIGIILKRMHDDSDVIIEPDEKFLTNVKLVINKLSYQNLENYLYCLHGIQKRFPQVVDKKFMQDVALNLKKCQGKFKTMSLEILMSGVEVLGAEAYSFLERNGLLEYVDDPDTGVQLATLKTLEKLLLNSTNKSSYYLTQREKESLLNAVCQVAVRNSAAAPCRHLAYQILSNAPEANQQTQNVLLSGLADPDPGIRDFVLSVWRSDRSLPMEAADRLLHIIAHLYSKETEMHFLGYALQVLLEACTVSPDYNLNIYSEPLHECRFEEYPISVSWRTQNLSSVPLFADTLASQMIGSELDGSVQIKSTQTTLAFEPTVANERLTFAQSFQQNPEFSSTSTSLFSSRIRTSPYTSVNKASEMVKGNDLNASSINLKRRFLRDEKKIGYYFARKEVKRTEKLSELREERSRKEGAINLLRKYRKGDLPDIEVPYSAFLKPLQSLAKMDMVIARQLLVSVSMGIIQELYEKYEDFADRLKHATDNILKNTVSCPPMLISALIEVALLKPKSIILDIENVSTVCRESNMFSIGCLLLEGYVINDIYSDHSTPVKRQRGPPGDILQLRLAELYEGLEDWDSVQGIFLNYLDTTESLRKALSHQADLEWDYAKESYMKAFNETSCDDLKDFCRSSYYMCLAHLSSWNNITVKIKNEVLDGDWDELWSDSWCTEKLLPIIFASHLHLKLSGKDCSEFERCVDEWLTDDTKKTYLQHSMSEELSLMRITNKEFVRANIHAEQHLSLFLQQWAQISPVSYSLRIRKLMDLQRVIEKLIYIGIAKMNNVDVSKLEYFMKPWLIDSPSATSSLLDWEQKVSYRSYFARQMFERLSGHDDISWLQKCEVVCKMGLVNLALLQNNYSVAKKYIAALREEVINFDESITIGYKLYENRFNWLKALKSMDKKKKLDMMIGVMAETAELQKMSKEKNCLEECTSISYELCKFSDDFLHIIKKDPQAVQALSSASMDCLKRTVKCDKIELTALDTSIISFGFSAATEAVDAAEREVMQMNSSQDDKNVKSMLSESYLSLAQYCRSHCETSENYETSLVISLLKAMKYGSAEARQLFPCLLQLPHLSSNLLHEFKLQSASIPEWMFLGWVSQILASLDSPVGKALDDIVIRMAEAYPQALVYPFRVSLEKYTFDGVPSNDSSAKPVIQRLKAILSKNSHVQEFASAISWLCLPHKMLENEITKLCGISNSTELTASNLKNKLEAMLKKLFVSRRKMLTSGSNALCGTIFTEIDKYYSDNNKRPRSSKQQTDKEDMNLYAALKAVEQGNIEKALEIIRKCKMLCGQHKLTKTKQNLRDFSPWLSDFQGDKWGKDLEIPGQYTGESRPLPHLHVKITSFHPEVMIMRSLRNPLRLTILGNDAKEHRCLVKYGEDLRLDQRIQQLLCLMRKILAQDSTCRDRQLSIKTYEVVPLSSTYGYIQWVDNSKSLKNVIESSYTQDESRTANQIAVRYNEWLNAASGSKHNLGVKEIYYNAYRKYSRDQTIRVYNENVNSLPWDILRRAIWNISTSAEVFFTKRHNFASSYATMCICHWLLGIGDRHLDNCLMFPHNGQCVGIDFGCAFGIATQFLPVPELVPFRLTPHLINLMEPHKTSGIIMETMVHVLRALRCNNKLLLAAMEVFIQEPSLDWLENAKRMSLWNSESDIKWFSKQKLSLTKEKFDGANPTTITEKELRSGPSRDGPEYLKVLWGENSQRFALRNQVITPQQQVTCLLEQATDPHILGKTFSGWLPWV